jgi:manganese transport protein
MSQPEKTSEAAPNVGWRKPAGQASLAEVHRSILVPVTASFWRKLLAFSGPGFLVAVGYMDPGNWATDLQGGAQFGYTLLSVIMISNLMAILLQHLSIKLGVATGRDLAQACRDHYSTPTVWFLWILCEIAIAACDLAEVVGSAIALQLLFGIPLVWGCVITAADVLAVLYLQNKGFRYIEALVITLIATIGTCFAAEIIWSKPGFVGMMLGFVPSPEILRNQDMLYVSIGIIGATVMPHNLYLHSSIVQTRKYEQNAGGKREAIKFATIDSTVALMFALFINAAILILAAAAFHWSGHQDVAEIQDAYKLLPGALGVTVASIFCRRAARFGTKFHAHRHARRPDRHGRFHQHPPAPVAAPSDHARHRHHSRRLRHRIFWRRQNHATARRQPGRAVHATRFCHLAADAFHRRKKEDGRIRQSNLDQNSRLDDRRDYHCPQRETAF